MLKTINLLVLAHKNKVKQKSLIFLIQLTYTGDCVVRLVTPLNWSSSCIFSGALKIFSFNKTLNGFYFSTFSLTIKLRDELRCN